MRILFYGLNLGPPWVEGLRNTVRSLSRRLAERGFDVTVLTSRGTGRSSFEGVEYVGLGVGGHAYSEGAPRVLGALSLWVAKHSGEFDVVHGHSSFPLIALPGLLSASPSVFTLYSHADFSEAFSADYGLLGGAALRLSKWGLLTRLASAKVRFVAISEGVRRSLPAAIGGRCPVIPVGVEFERFYRGDSGGVRSELGAGSGKLVLFAGDVTPWKGGDDFLVAAGLLAKEFDDVRFLFLTKGTYEHEERRLRALGELSGRLGLDGRVRFLGRRGDIDAVYRAADVVVLPYRSMFSFMSTPLSLLEAMSAGRPVVATRVGDTPSIVSEGVNGLLCRPAQPFELAEKVRTLLLDEEYARRLGEAASRTARRYDWSKVVDDYVGLYVSMAR